MHRNDTLNHENETFAPRIFMHGILIHEIGIVKMTNALRQTPASDSGKNIRVRRVWERRYSLNQSSFFYLFQKMPRGSARKTGRGFHCRIILDVGL